MLSQSINLGLKGATDEENAIIDMFADEVQDCITAIKPYLMARFRGIGDLVGTNKLSIRSNFGC